jgi:predicted GIY-YIG superfamily endonuclease
MIFTEKDLQLKARTYYGYLMASRSLNLYTGITNSIYRRALQRKARKIDGFTKRYIN